VVSAPARRELVRQMVDKGLSERRSLAVVGMSASAYRYVPCPDHNVDLRQRIVALAQRHKRYGVGMIHLKLRQAGLLVNYKRVERLYQEAKLQVRRRKRRRCLSPIREARPSQIGLLTLVGWRRARFKAHVDLRGTRKTGACVHGICCWARLSTRGQGVDSFGVGSQEGLGCMKIGGWI
jgi:hypothetical protein